MAIEFQFQGEWYRVDSPQEVVALKKYLRAHGQEKEGSSSDSQADLPAHGKWTSDLFTSLMEKIGYFEKKFLAALLSVSQPIDALSQYPAFSGLRPLRKETTEEEVGMGGVVATRGRSERARAPCQSPRARTVRRISSSH